MPIDVRLIATDAPPLITLAAAGKLGAREILGWYRLHTDEMRVEPPEIF